jgi:hypothetical protein
VTVEQAKELGYEVVITSPFEVGLVKNGQGIRTWWNSDFGHVPSLDHPVIQQAIEMNEALGIFWKPASCEDWPDELEENPR